MPNRVILVIIFSLVWVVLLSACSGHRKLITSEVNLDQYSANIHIELNKPQGEGPFPAIVFMHGCSGLGALEKQGLKLHSDYFIAKGYVTLIVDSFAGRGIEDDSVCRDLEALSSARYYRTFDAFTAYQYLDQLSFVDESIYLVGQSNGGSVALQAATKQWQQTIGYNKRFSAIVAYYPWCGAISGNGIEINTPVLVLAGEKDKWTPARECISARQSFEHGMLEVMVYPDAYHSFDLPVPVQQFNGYKVGLDRSALKDSRIQILSFFAQHK